MAADPTGRDDRAPDTAFGGYPHLVMRPFAGFTCRETMTFGDPHDPEARQRAIDEVRARIRRDGRRRCICWAPGDVTYVEPGGEIHHRRRAPTPPSLKIGGAGGGVSGVFRKRGDDRWAVSASGYTLIAQALNDFGLRASYEAASVPLLSRDLLDGYVCSQPSGGFGRPASRTLYGRDFFRLVRHLLGWPEPRDLADDEPPIEVLVARAEAELAERVAAAERRADS